MKIVRIEIENFRGIKHASVAFPQKSRIICLIGAGDSGKSTLLTAIEWALWPSWNLIVTDADFYNGDTSAPIKISASVSEFPDELTKEDKYGLYLRDYEKMLQGGDDEPSDNGLRILTIQLTIDDTLEPKWNVITDRTEPKSIGYKERRLLSFGVVGFDYEKDFQWGRNSVLQKYANSKDELRNNFTQTMRSAVETTTFEELDQETSEKLNKIGELYSVGFNEDIHNKLLMQNGSYSTAVGVFDGKVPFTQKGLGSKRLLSIGLNVNAYNNDTLVLVDEIETGLEPYRIITLINLFRKQFKDKGQLIMTTHSRSVVCECNVAELCVVINSGGELKVQSLDEIKEIEGSVQGIVREEPDAFFCKGLIVCEGKTEVGLLRALDKKLFERIGKGFAYEGVGYALGGGGSKSFKLARLLNRCGYRCCILMDSDLTEEDNEKREVEQIGIEVFSWEEGNSVEEQFFKDATVSCAEQLLEYAVELKGIQAIETQLNNRFKIEERFFKVENGKVSLCGDNNGVVSQEFLRNIGTVAKGKIKRDRKEKKETEGGWFKRIDFGQEVGNIIFSSDSQMRSESYFNSVIARLLKWTGLRYES